MLCIRKMWNDSNRCSLLLIKILLEQNFNHKYILSYKIQLENELNYFKQCSQGVNIVENSFKL